MGIADKVIAAARAEVGYLEKASNAKLDSKTANAGYGNFTKFGRWFGWNGVAWCHIFVSWVAAQAGCAALIPRTASCYEGRDWFIDRGRFHRRTDGYNPRVGDVVYFSTGGYPSGGGHVGIVTDCRDGYVYTVEGNTSDADGIVANGGCVAAKKYKLGHSGIYGYGCPDYEEEPEVVKTANVLIDGKVYPCDVIEKDGHNYVKLRALQQAGYQVVYDSARDMPTVTAPDCRANVPAVNEDMANAIVTVQQRYGLEDSTIEYMRRYRYGDNLLRKLAQG